MRIYISKYRASDIQRGNSKNTAPELSPTLVYIYIYATLKIVYLFRLICPGLRLPPAVNLSVLCKHHQH